MSSQNLDLQWFSAEDEGRTEEPSLEKLRKAREEGRVAKSQELCGSVVFFVTSMVLIFTAKNIFTTCLEVYRFFFNRCTDLDFFQASYGIYFLTTLGKLVLPIGFSGMVAGVLANIIQNKGFLFTWKPIAPKFSKIIPKFAEYFKNTLFSLKGVFNIFKSLIKVAIIVFIAYFLMSANIPVILNSIGVGSMLVPVGNLANMAAQMIVIISVLFLLISIPDFFINKREFMESMKMTKQEVKDEYKELEGDPQVKGKIRQQIIELMQQDLPNTIRDSDVVIANPTHYAVSMKYDRDVANEPMVTAKGQGEVALYIRRLAEENGVPVVENKPLARSLYSELDVGDVIPEGYWELLAKVYAEVVKYNAN